MDRAAFLAPILVAILIPGCAGPDARPDRGPPRLLDDGSMPFGDGTCVHTGETIGWNVSTYNVGGPGRIYLALLANGEPVEIQPIDVEGDRPALVKLGWDPRLAGNYEIQVGWDLDGNFSPTDHGQRLVGPVTIRHGCWI